MYCDRETDILYLAHRLWEESEDPTTSPRTCWTQAAREILARSPRPRSEPAKAPITTGAFSCAKGTLRIKFRASDGIGLGGRTPATVVANAPLRLARLAE